MVEVPKYVRECGRRTLLLRRRSDGAASLACLTCRSWRCDGCAPSVARRDLDRIAEALFLHGRPEDAVYLVLTFARRDRGQVQGYASVFDAYAALARAWPKLRKRLARRFGVTGFGYVATGEQHGDGFPHLNVLFYCPELAALAGADWQAAAALIRRHVVEAGFGSQFYIEGGLRTDRRTMAAYLVKASFRGAGRELGKVSQAPVTAPKGFRRLRSSRRFMAPLRSRGPSKYRGLVLYESMPRATAMLAAGELERALRSLEPPPALPARVAPADAVPMVELLGDAYAPPGWLRGGPAGAARGGPRALDSAEEQVAAAPKGDERSATSGSSGIQTGLFSGP